MKRWRRFAGRPAAVLSLLVCAATAILWVRSYRTMDELFLIYKGEGSEELSSVHGQIRFKHTLPQTGSRQGVARISHRTNRVVALPPRPWAEERLKPKWIFFRYDDSVLDPIKVKQARTAEAAVGNFVNQPIPATNPNDPRFAARQRKLMQLMVASMQANRGRRIGSSESYWAVTCPMWVLMVPAILLVPVSWAVSTLRRAVRSRAGRCRSCGYDLTGNTSGVCPECGATVRDAGAIAPTA